MPTHRCCNDFEFLPNHTRISFVVVSKCNFHPERPDKQPSSMLSNSTKEALNLLEERIRRKYAKQREDQENEISILRSSIAATEKVNVDCTCECIDR